MEFPLSRYRNDNSQTPIAPIMVTENAIDRRPETVTYADKASFAYFLSDPSCKSFQLTVC